jgi:hypothetical protein
MFELPNYPNNNSNYRICSLRKKVFLTKNKKACL